MARREQRPYCPLLDGECLGSGCAWAVMDQDIQALICAVALMAAEGGQRILEQPKREASGK